MKMTNRMRLYLRQHYFLLFIIIVLLVIWVINLITIGNLKDEVAQTRELEAYPTPAPYYVITMPPEPTNTPNDDPLAAKMESNNTWTGPVLNVSIGTVEGPSGKETYYNLPMDGVISIMRDLGYSEEEYPYWVRDDGCKMLGDYIMCAANLDVHPRGTLVESSLGTCLVCDTGEFAYSNAMQLDIAVDW